MCECTDVRTSCAGDALTYAWIGTDADEVAAAGPNDRTLAGGHLIVSDPATANKVYDNDIFFKNGPADYSSPVLHTVRFWCCHPASCGPEGYVSALLCGVSASSSLSPALRHSTEVVQHVP